MKKNVVFAKTDKKMSNANHYFGQFFTDNIKAATVAILKPQSTNIYKNFLLQQQEKK